MNNLITTPTNEDVEYVRVWLEQEFSENGEGFYCNWNVIESSHQRKGLFLFQNQDKPIGLMSFRHYEKVVCIDIVSIHPEYRKQGLGRSFFQLCSEYFVQNGVYVAELDCSPRSSERFWKSVGFVEFPFGFRNRYHLGVYKPLIETANACPENPQSNFLKLQGFDKSWYWEIDEVKDKPIIFPCTGDSLLSLHNNGQIVKEEKVKYFSTLPIYDDDYLIIEPEMSRGIFT